MARYRRTQLPAEYDSVEVMKEFERVERAISLHDLLTLEEQFVEPERPRTGMTALADGTQWNPGSGQGVYSYYAGAWHKLG